MAALNLNTVRATVEGRVGTELANSPAIPVVYHNMAYEPTPASSWVQCLVSFGSNQYLSLGGTSGSDNRVVGLMTLNIFTAIGVGPGANYTIGKRLRDLFNRQRVSDVYFDAAVGPEVLGAPAPEGYFQTQIRVTFEAIESL